MTHKGLKYQYYKTTDNLFKISQADKTENTTKLFMMEYLICVEWLFQSFI